MPPDDDRPTLLGIPVPAPVVRRLGAGRVAALLEFFRFGVVGTLGFLVDAGVLLAAIALGLGPWVGRLVSFLAAATVTYSLNRAWTFRRRTGGGGASAGQWARFVVVNLGGFAANYRDLRPAAFEQRHGRGLAGSRRGGRLHRRARGEFRSLAPLRLRGEAPRRVGRVAPPALPRRPRRWRGSGMFSPCFPAIRHSREPTALRSADPGPAGPQTLSRAPLPRRAAGDRRACPRA